MLFINKFKLFYLKVYYNCLKIGTTINLSTDINLIIECCKTSQNIDEIKELVEQVKDWEEFIDLAYTHGVFPLVYHTLKLYIDIIPTEVLKTMKSYNMDIVKQNMLMTSELIKVMKLLEENNIEAIAFKGPTLSQMAYGDIALRQYIDLDILVKKDDVYNVATILLENFYIPMDSIEFLKNEAKLHTEKNYEFYNKSNSIKLEVHWKLINTQLISKFNNNEIWNTFYKIKLNSYEMNILNNELFLLYLCNHGSSHMWERIEWIVDVNKFILKHEKSLKWDRVITLSEKLDSNTLLLLGLNLINRLFNTKLPLSVEKLLINNTKIQSLTTQVLVNTNGKKTDISTDQQNIEQFKFYLAIKKTYIAKFIFIIKTIFSYSNHDIMSVNLPKKYHALYFFVRIYRIIKKYLKI